MKHLTPCRKQDRPDVPFDPKADLGTDYALIAASVGAALIALIRSQNDGPAGPPGGNPVKHHCATATGIPNTYCVNRA